jgi:uncharacterized protein with GYD domain
MAKYLVRAAYTPEGAKGLLKDGGSKRIEVVRQLMKSVGGTVEAAYFALGEHDFICIADVPDNVALTALALTTNASGAVRLSTTALITAAEVDEAVKKAVAYTPPGR